MTQIILIILGGVAILVLLSRKTREQVVGICSSALDQTVRKSANKEKALAFIQEKMEAGPEPSRRGESYGASNEEIREHLGVSRRSVARYLDELEKEGKVEQVGDIGRDVTYRLKA